MTLGIYQYLGAYVSNWSSVMAAAVLASVPALVLLVVAQRFVAAGLSDGADAPMVRQAAACVDWSCR